jgi:glycosyltransferase involved in cell wall biosynthesis
MTVSAIIPTYNAARWIARAIDSVLSQTHPVDEIIVVDDGSTDNTAEVVAGFGERVRYIRQSNGGPAKARNTGIRAATTEWVAFLDADDWWETQKLELQMAALHRNPNAILCYTGWKMVQPNGEVRLVPAWPTERLWPALRYRSPIPPATVIARRESVLAVGGFNPRHRGNEDWEMWVKLWRHGRFISIPENVTCYAWSPEGLSGDGERMFRDFLPMLEETLISDLRGIRRSLWRRRILAWQAFDTGIYLREAGSAEGERKFLLQSLAAWPSPFWRPRRYAAAAVMLKRQLLGRMGTPAARGAE